MIRRKIKNSLVLVFITILLSSCGIFNKVFKKSNKYKEDTEIVTDKTTNDKTIDKSIKTVVEKVDTTVKTKPKQVENDIPVKDIKDLDNTTVLSNNLVTVKQTFDSIAQKLKTIVDIHSQDIDIKLDKTTTIKNDITKDSKSKDNSKATTQIKAKESEKIKEPKNILWYVILGIGAVLGVFAVGRFITKKYFNK